MPLSKTHNHGPTHRNACVVICLTIIAAMLWTAPPATADIYQWKDARGNWHFSDTPPTGVPFTSTPESNSNQTPVAQSAGETEKPPPSIADETVKEGMLWRIEREGVPPSYLLGTIHSDDPRVTRLKPAVARALDQCDRFVMEMKLDTNAFMHFGAVMLMEQGQDLETLVGKGLYTQVATAMEGSGIPEPMVRRLKPWVVISMLSMPKSQGGLILDMVLYQRATAQGKSTSGLESAQEQLAVFEGLSMDDQIALLELTIEQLPSQPQTFDRLIKAYATDDLQVIQRLSEQNNRTKGLAVAKRFMSRLNDERNLRMAHRMAPHLDQGNSFVAVGALHLGGPKGLLELLRQQGYRATPVR